MKASKLVFIGVGGQGNLLASRLIGEAALSAGIPAVVSEIHGMAQRGGIVESAVLLGGLTSPIVSRGEADVLIGFEPLETLRALDKCNKESVIITNTRPLPPFTVAVGQGNYPAVETILPLLRAKVATVISMDANKLAEQAGNPLSVNMVLLGALLGSKTTRLEPASVKQVISTSTKKAFLESNIAAFEAGLAYVEKNSGE
jgi:indolepyruvate ferredoxin oxidoreductase, beta subunit